MQNDKRRKLAKLWDWIMGSVRNMSLACGFLCGCISVLVDFDHIIQILFNTGNRPFHIYSFIIAVFVMFCCCAYIGRFCLKFVLKDEKRS